MKKYDVNIHGKNTKLQSLSIASLESNFAPNWLHFSTPEGLTIRVANPLTRLHSCIIVAQVKETHRPNSNMSIAAGAHNFPASTHLCIARNHQRFCWRLLALWADWSHQSSTSFPISNVKFQVCTYQSQVTYQWALYSCSCISHFEGIGVNILASPAFLLFPRLCPSRAAPCPRWLSTTAWGGHQLQTTPGRANWDGNTLICNSRLLAPGTVGMLT